ncbi:hypothetical protein ACULPM_09810, partial [Thermophilibacter sp. ZX-H3]
APSPSASRAASEERSDERRAAGRGRGGTSEGVTNGNLQRLWKQVVDQLVAQVPAKGSLLLSSTAVSDDGEKLTVSLPKGSHFAARMLERADVRESVEPVISAAFGPRQVVYVESSLANQAISRSERPAPAPAPAPRPQPAPQPASRPAPAAPAPAQSAPDPAPAYPMPWDAPTPAPQPAAQAAPAPQEPAAEQVPYSDADITVYEETYEPEVTFPAQTAAPAAPPANPAPAPADSPAVAPAATSETSEERSDERRADGQGPSAVGGGGELTPEFADIASMLAEAFGQPLEVSVESAVTTSDEDAAAELAYDGDPASDDGFTAEPEEDEDDD